MSNRELETLLATK